uniref:ATP-dependent DNA ligase family profile domain-containing protein n=1 Tax=Biomphalaria glabrata TaxID=6526 RepID=A0A2C9KW30_BIOGL
MSEKLDGVRAFWNGRCFYSRLGNALYAPEFFTKDLPKDMHLDGELFGGRGQFQSTISIVKTSQSPKWNDIKYCVFDSPNMGKEVFETRMQRIKEYFENVNPSHAVFVEQTKCRSKEHLEEEMARLLNIGAEGIMLRKPNSIYRPCRSITLLKYKKFYYAEAVVIKHVKSNRYTCRALKCRMACGIQFYLGLTYNYLHSKFMRHPPKIGTIITYKFQELFVSGCPRFATFVGVCKDKTEPRDAQIRQVLNEEEV